MNPDPLDEALKKVGVHLEKRPDVQPMTQMLASGAGGIAGHVLGGVAGFGTIGKMVASLAGSVIGHVAVTYRVEYHPPGSGGEPVNTTPAPVSDRR